MTTFNILIYTDSADFSLGNDDEDFRLTILQSLLATKRLGFAEFKLTVINRYQGFDEPNPSTPPQIKKLTTDVLAGFDEIWFFGWYQKNVEQEFSVLFGGRENELDDDEVKVLTEWMST